MLLFPDVLPAQLTNSGITTNDCQPEVAFDDTPLTNGSEFSDVTLVVEGRKLYTSRLILASASPVWRALLTSELKEKNQPEIPLPGKPYRDVCELLLCITPGIKKQIDGEKIMICLVRTANTNNTGDHNG